VRAARAESHPSSATLTVEAAGVPSALGPSRAAPGRGPVPEAVRLPVARPVRRPETQNERAPGQRSLLGTRKPERTEFITLWMSVKWGIGFSNVLMLFSTWS